VDSQITERSDSGIAGSREDQSTQKAGSRNLEKGRATMRMTLITTEQIENLQQHLMAYCSGRIYDQRGENGLSKLGQKC
jgi:hypothetical protein